MDPSNNRSLKTTELKSNRFQILENNIFQKIITNETNIKFQKTTELKKQQFSKNIIYQKTTNLKKTDIKKTGMKKSVFFCNVSNNVQFCRFVETKYS